MTRRDRDPIIGAGNLVGDVLRRRDETRRRLDAAMTEDELLTAITEAATYLGWRWVHFRRSDLAIQQGHSGFPDLVLARNGRILFLELKRQGGELSPDQVAWQRELMPAAGWRWQDRVDSLVVYPDALDTIIRILAPA